MEGGEAWAKAQKPTTGKCARDTGKAGSVAGARGTAVRVFADEARRVRGQVGRALSSKPRCETVILANPISQSRKPKLER